jgi:hypothetical protein
MTNYTSYEKYIAKCDCCYSPKAVSIYKTIYNTGGPDPVKVCTRCFVWEINNKVVEPIVEDAEPF